MLISCAHVRVYQPEVQQGNIITQSQMNKLKKGMTQTQVENLLGDPVLQNIFEPDQKFYIYTLSPTYGKKVTQKVVLFFKNNRLAKVERF